MATPTNEDLSPNQYKHRQMVRKEEPTTLEDHRGRYQSRGDIVGRGYTLPVLTFNAFSSSVTYRNKTFIVTSHPRHLPGHMSDSSSGLKGTSLGFSKSTSRTMHGRGTKQYFYRYSWVT